MIQYLLVADQSERQGNTLMHKRNFLDSNARGNRIKSARMLGGLSRRKFASVSKISLPTLRSWEEPSIGRGGLTENGAQRLSAAFLQHGIVCSTEWLLSGKGSSPKFLESTEQSIIEIEDESIFWNEDESIIRDIEAFKKHNAEAIVALIQDAAMVPFFSLGDFVGGYRLYGDRISYLVGLNCIIETQGNILVRKIAKKYTDDLFELSPINLQIEHPKIVTIESAAEIIWHRKRSSIRHISVGEHECQMTN